MFVVCLCVVEHCIFCFYFCMFLQGSVSVMFLFGRLCLQHTFLFISDRLASLCSVCRCLMALLWFVLALRSEAFVLFLSSILLFLVNLV